MRIASLTIHPLKGARGISVSRADVLRAGLRHDRRFMVVDPNGEFMTQRSHPRLALVHVAIEGSTLSIRASHTDVVVPLVPTEGPRRSVRVWEDTCEAIDLGVEAAALLSEHLGTRCSLVAMPSTTHRQINRKYANDGEYVSFADDFPLLLATQASLDDLNARLDSPLPMNRFRPNVVVEGGAAWDEDRHARAVLGTIAFRMAKRCSRCVVTTIDQDTLEQGVEPLRTLAKFRAEDSKVYFAQNLIPDAEGTLSVGDPVTFEA